MYKKILLALLLLIVASPLFANTQNTGMPWETTLETIQRSITGPVARVIALILIVGGGVGLAVSGGQGMGKMIWIAVGLGIALGAANLLTTLFGASGALI
jgi:type IV secretion system protein VirB2